MGEDKLLLAYQGKPLLQCVVDMLAGLPVYEKIIVTTESRLRKIDLPPGVQRVVNPDPEAGQSGSVRLGVENSAGTHFFFLAADQPQLTSFVLLPLLSAAEANPEMIIFPAINGKPCSPTLFPSFFRKKLLALSGDKGGRELRNAFPEMCYAVEPEFPEFFLDIDSKENYEELLRMEEDQYDK